MRIIDSYILKRFLKTLGLVIVIILPIGIAIDIAEKIEKFLHHNELTFWIILVDYYQHFVIMYGNLFLPLALFIAVILFTSRLANNTEIIAMHSAQISFKRLLFPYFLGASIVFLFALLMNHFVVPTSNNKFERFTRSYIFEKKDPNYIYDISLQLNEDEYIIMKTFSIKQNTGSDFMYERFKETQLKYRLKANNIKWNKKDSTYTLNSYSKRYILPGIDRIESGSRMDTVFLFYPKDLYYIDYLAKEMESSDLKRFIRLSKERRVKNLNPYKVELQKRTSLPFSVFILTMIAVALAAKKKRGGIGINLAVGIALMFIYIFFMKVTEVLGAVAGRHTLFLVWLPNIIFGVLAIYFYWNAARK